MELELLEGWGKFDFQKTSVTSSVLHSLKFIRIGTVVGWKRRKNQEGGGEIERGTIPISSNT